MNDLDPAQRSDAQLAAALAAGDTSAISHLAERHASGLYDFALRTTLEVAAAETVVETALRRALDQAAKRPRSLAAHAWLYGLARDEALDVLRQRGRGDGETEQSPAPLSPLDDRLVRVQDAAMHDMALWAWQAARSQRPRDYSLLDLSLRRRLSPEEIADVAGLSRTGIYAVLGRLRGAFEESLSATALYYHGRSACPELDELAKNSPELRPALRREIARHVETCMTCRDTIAEMPLAADLFAMLKDAEPTPELVDKLDALYFPPLATDGTPPAAAAVSPPAEQAAQPSVPAAIQPSLSLAAAAAAEAAATAPEPEIAPEPVVEAEPEAVEATEVAAELEETPEEPPAAAVEQPVEEMVEQPRAEVFFAPTALDVVAPRAAEPEPELPAAEAEPEPEVEPAASIEEEPEVVSVEVEEPPEEVDEDEVLEPEEPEPLVAAQAIDIVKDEEPEPVYGEDEEPSFGEDEEPVGVFRSPFDMAEPEQADEEPEFEAPLIAAFTPPGEDDQLAEEETYEGELEDEDLAAEEEDDRRALPRNVPLTFTRGASRQSTPSPAPELIRFSREDLRTPRRSASSRAGGMFGDGSGARRVSMLVLMAGLTLVAIYVAIVLGDSLSGGGDGSQNGISALPTRQGGLRQLDCGTAPLVVDQGQGSTLSLDAKALNGYNISNVEVKPVSANAAARNVQVSAQGLNIQFGALVAPGPAGRLDEYKLAITLAKGNERLVSECTVQVRAPATAANTPAPATTGTVTPAGTPGTPRPATTTTPGATGSTGATGPTGASGAGTAATATPVRTPAPAVTAPPGSTATRVP